ncbi:unnamed protein product [Cylicocyclus nassatus]|uniref:Apple domain-containing protein n=1 Tax=Cylicocyclus nassatus TaxID=53992 RepID=A0AA36H7P5_CYLNA|nr:unnamed protein product [Cylicocyclus nassatus]
MATKWLAFLLFFIQAEYLSCCVFEKVNKFMIGNSPVQDINADKNRCFAACYAKKDCSAIMYYKKNNRCFLVEEGETPDTCGDMDCYCEDCYILQRDEVDPVCKTFVNF